VLTKTGSKTASKENGVKMALIKIIKKW